MDSGWVPLATLCSVRLTDKSENLNYEASLKSAVSGRYPNIAMASNCYNIVSQSRYISQMICSGVVSAMAFFVLLIARVVIVSNIINYIQVNMKNLGVLKAAGYTSGQLVRSLLLQFLSLAVLAAMIGMGLSYLLFPAVNAMMIAQTGIPYDMRFLPLPIIISLAALAGAVALAVWLASRRIKKIEPIAALRSGIQTHNFKRDHIPLEKTKAPVNLALALKTTLSGVKPPFLNLNEIAIAAKYARENGFKAGDEIEIAANGRQEKYLICGFTQITNNLGRDCLLTRAGYERLGILAGANYYINLTDGTDIDAFNLEMKEKFDGRINTAINILTTIEGSAGVYVSLMTIIVIAILALSAVIAAFVLYLLVRIMLNNKQRDYGILKSLGFTTRQLILQTALSFMPTTVLSAGIGLSVCCLIINPLTALFLNGIGIVKCTFKVPVGFVAAAGGGLVLFAFVTVCLLMPFTSFL